MQPDRKPLVEFWGDGVGFGLLSSTTGDGKESYVVVRIDLNVGEGPDGHHESAEFQEPFQALEAFVSRPLLPNLVITILDVSFRGTFHRLLAGQGLVLVATDSSRPGEENYRARDSGVPTSFILVIDLGDSVGLTGKWLITDLRKIVSVTSLLDEVWTRGNLGVSKYSYGVDWTLVISRTGRTLEHARMSNPDLRGKPVPDSRKLSEVGLQPGDLLVVHKSEGQPAGGW